MKRHAATVTDVVSIQTHSLNHVVSRTIHRASVIQTVKQTVQLFRKGYTENVTVVQQLTRVADSSICIEHIISPA
jgi:hypothetical protein